MKRTTTWTWSGSAKGGEEDRFKVVATLALGSQPKQRLVRVRAKKVA
jgi:hypothetical protein